MISCDIFHYTQGRGEYGILAYELSLCHCAGNERDVALCRRRNRLKQPNSQTAPRRSNRGTEEASKAHYVFVCRACIVCIRARAFQAGLDGKSRQISGNGISEWSSSSSSCLPGGLEQAHETGLGTFRLPFGLFHKGIYRSGRTLDLGLSVGKV